MRYFDDGYELYAWIHENRAGPCSVFLGHAFYNGTEWTTRYEYNPQEEFYAYCGQVALGPREGGITQ